MIAGIKLRLSAMLDMRFTSASSSAQERDPGLYPKDSRKGRFRRNDGASTSGVEKMRGSRYPDATRLTFLFTSLFLPSLVTASHSVNSHAVPKALFETENHGFVKSY